LKAAEKRIDSRTSGPFFGCQPVPSVHPWVASRKSTSQSAAAVLPPAPSGWDSVLGEAQKRSWGMPIFFEARNLCACSLSRLDRMPAETVDTIGADGFQNWRMTAQPFRVVTDAPTRNHSVISAADVCRRNATSGGHGVFGSPYRQAGLVFDHFDCVAAELRDFDQREVGNKLLGFHGLARRRRQGRCGAL